MLCLLAAAGVVAAAAWIGGARAVAARDGGRDRRGRAAAVRPGARVLRPQRPRARAQGHPPARARVDGRPTSPRARRSSSSRSRRTSGRPTSGRLSSVTGNGARWIKFPTSRSRVRNDGTLGRRSRVVKLEDYERTTRPVDLDRLRAARGFCWVVTGSTQYGRAFAEPERCRTRSATTTAAARGAIWSTRSAPTRPGASRRVLVRLLVQRYPLAYERPGPEVRIYRLPGCKGRFGAT